MSELFNLIDPLAAIDVISKEEPLTINPEVESIVEAEDKKALADAVKTVLHEYLAKDKKEYNGSIYKELTALVELPLLQATLSHSKGNQLRAAKMLGLSRGGLRIKMKAQALL